ncbi:hypothetical protein JCM1841_005652 [Sporobolomyces salmonicolor]
MDSSKRPRASSSASSTSTSSSSSVPPPPSTKAVRPSSPPPPLYTCSLPPTCHITPSVHSTSESLDAHWRNYHAFVCSAPPPSAPFARSKGKEKQQEPVGLGGADQRRAAAACGRVFPDERMLQLHLTECHDELAQIRRDRGDKIFACFAPSCSRHFATPKTRRLHLIDRHAYPPQYFFGVTIWGIEDVLKKGGGMVRRDWKPRAGQPGWKRGGRASSDDDDDDDDEEEEESMMGPPSPSAASSGEPSPPPLHCVPPPMQRDDDVDALALSLSGTSISLVPRSVRLARDRAAKQQMAVEPTEPREKG